MGGGGGSRLSVIITLTVGNMICESPLRTLSLNDKHSCQLFRKASSLVLLSSSVSPANLSYLLATTFSSLRFLFNFTSLQSFESTQLGFLFSHFRVLSSILSLFFLCSFVSEALFTLSFTFVSERFLSRNQ